MNGYRIGSLAVVVLLGLVSIGLGWWANSSIRLGLLVAHTPVSWASAVLPGPAAVQGDVRVDQESLTGPFSRKQCVYYRKLIEREKKDSEGRTTWETVEDTSRHVPFRLQDESGSLLVRPGGAECRAPHIHRHREGKLRYTEYAIVPGSEVFVYGYSEGGQPQSADRVPFLVSGLGEKEYRQGKGVKSLLLCSLAISSASFAVGDTTKYFSKSMRSRLKFTIWPTVTRFSSAGRLLDWRRPVITSWYLSGSSQYAVVSVSVMMSTASAESWSFPRSVMTSLTYASYV